jgi:hypothetical protein
VDHLLSYCSVANEVWSFVFRSFGVAWVLPGSVVELLFGWRNWFGNHFSDVWNLVPLCLMWTVWWERNRRTFEDMESFVSQIIEVFAIFI